MKLRTVYCSACDRDVRVAVVHEPQTSNAVDPSAFLCLDCGMRCTGSLCPLAEVPLRGSGVEPERVDGPRTE
jgi:hypothetical protein